MQSAAVLGKIKYQIKTEYRLVLNIQGCRLGFRENWFKVSDCSCAQFATSWASLVNPEKQVVCTNWNKPSLLLLLANHGFYSNCAHLSPIWNWRVTGRVDPGVYNEALESELGQGTRQLHFVLRTSKKHQNNKAWKNITLTSVEWIVPAHWVISLFREMSRTEPCTDCRQKDLPSRSTSLPAPFSLLSFPYFFLSPHSP